MRATVTLVHDDTDSFYVELVRCIARGNAVVVLTRVQTPDTLPARLLDTLKAPSALRELAPLLDQAGDSFRPGASTTLKTDVSFLCLAIGLIVGAFFGVAHMVVGMLTGSMLDAVIARVRRSRMITVEVDGRGCLRLYVLSAGHAW